MERAIAGRFLCITAKSGTCPGFSFVSDDNIDIGVLKDILQLFGE
jgi:hypothetical protein